MNNRTAFLSMIAVSEGTKGKGNDGYNILFGGSTFDDYTDHPRRRFFIPRLGIYTTAAGRYQILAKTFDSYKAKLELPDFSPISQDEIASQILLERKALIYIDAGLIDTAILKCAEIWASFPTSTYGQGTKTFAQLRAAFIAAGGDYHASVNPNSQPSPTNA